MQSTLFKRQRTQMTASQSNTNHMPSVRSVEPTEVAAEEQSHWLSWDRRLAHEDECDRRRAQRLPQALRTLQSRYFWWKVVYGFRQSAAMLPALVITQNPTTSFLVTNALFIMVGTLVGSRETFGGGFAGVVELAKGSVFGVPLLTIIMAVNAAHDGYVWGVVYFFSLVGGWFILDGVARKMLTLCVIAIMVGLGAYKWHGVGPARSLWYPSRLCFEMVCGGLLGTLSTLAPWPKLAQRRADQKMAKAADLLSAAYVGLCCDSFWVKNNTKRRVNIVKIQTIKRNAVTLLADAQVCLGESRFEPQTLDAYYLRVSKFQLISAMPALFDSTLRALSAISDDPLRVQDSPNSNVFKQHMTGPMRDLAEAVAEALALVGSSRDPADFSPDCMRRKSSSDNSNSNGIGGSDNSAGNHPFWKVKKALKRVDAALSKARREVYYTAATMAAVPGQGGGAKPSAPAAAVGQQPLARAFSFARSLAIPPPSSPHLTRRRHHCVHGCDDHDRGAACRCIVDDTLLSPELQRGVADDEVHPKDGVYRMIANSEASSGVSGQELSSLLGFHVFAMTRVARKLMSFPAAVEDRRRGRTLQLILWEEVRDFLLTPFSATKQFAAFLAFAACSVHVHLLRRGDDDAGSSSSSSPSSPHHGPKTTLHTPPAVMRFFAPVTKEQSLMAAMRFREALKFAVAMGCAMLFDYYAYFDEDYSFMSGPTVTCFLSGLTTSETTLNAVMRLFGTMLGCVIGFFFSNYADTPTTRTAAVCSVMVFLGFFRSGKKFGPAALYAGIMLNAMLGAPIVMNKAIARLTQVTFTILIYTAVSLVVFPTQPSVILTKARIQTLRALGKTVEVIMKGFVMTVAASVGATTPTTTITTCTAHWGNANTNTNNAGGHPSAAARNGNALPAVLAGELRNTADSPSASIANNEPFADCGADTADHRSVTVVAAVLGNESSSSSSSSTERCSSTEPPSSSSSSSSSDDDDDDDDYDYDDTEGASKLKDQASHEKRKLTAIDADGGIDFNEDCVPSVDVDPMFPQPSRAPVFISDENSVTRMTSTLTCFDGTTEEAAAKRRRRRHHHHHARSGDNTSSIGTHHATACLFPATTSVPPATVGVRGSPSACVAAGVVGGGDGGVAVVAIAPPPAPADPLLGVAGAVRMLEMLIAKTSAWVPLAEIEPSLSRIPYPATTSVAYHEVIVRMRSLLDMMVESLGMIRAAQTDAAEQQRTRHHNCSPCMGSGGGGRGGANNCSCACCCALVGANRPFVSLLEDLQPIVTECGVLLGSVAKRMADKLADASGHKRAVWQCTNALADADDDFDEDASLLSTAVRFEEQCLALHTQKSIASHQLVKLARMLADKRMARRRGGCGGGDAGAVEIEELERLRAVLAANNGRFPTRVGEWTDAELSVMADALLGDHKEHHHNHIRGTDLIHSSPAVPVPLLADGAFTAAGEDSFASSVHPIHRNLTTTTTDSEWQQHSDSPRPRRVIGPHRCRCRCDGPTATHTMRMLVTNADMVGLHAFSTALVLFGREVTRLLTVADSLGRYLLAAAAA